MNTTFTLSDETRIATFYNEDGSIQSTRPFTTEENANADERLTSVSQMTNLEERVARIEAKLWPPMPDAPDPTFPADAPAFDGVWANGQLVIDKGIIYRNVSGVPLTSAPSSFPGSPSQWTHLFEVSLAPEPVDPPGPTVKAWNKDTSYKVGDKATRNGRLWEALVAHGAAYQGTWGPPTTGVWKDIGPA